MNVPRYAKTKPYDKKPQLRQTTCSIPLEENR